MTGAIVRDRRLGGPCPAGCGHLKRFGFVVCVACWRRLTEDQRVTFRSAWHRFKALRYGPQAWQVFDELRAAREVVITACRGNHEQTELPL